MADGLNGAVVRTCQVPELIECLKLVAGRIDRQREQDGDEYLRGFGDAPDDNDPAVIRENRIAPLLDIDEAEVTSRLNSISLFAMTRAPGEAMAKELSDLRRQP